MPVASGSESLTSTKEGQTVVDLEARELLRKILLEIRILNANMCNVTDEEIDEVSLPDEKL